MTKYTDNYFTDEDGQRWVKLEHVNAHIEIAQNDQCEIMKAKYIKEGRESAKEDIIYNVISTLENMEI